jgi:hypothetical protein
MMRGCAAARAAGAAGAGRPRRRRPTRPFTFVGYGPRRPLGRSDPCAPAQPAWRPQERQRQWQVRPSDMETQRLLPSRFGGQGARPDDEDEAPPPLSPPPPLIVPPAAEDRSSTAARAEITSAGEQIFEVRYSGRPAQLKVGQLNVQLLQLGRPRHRTVKTLGSWLYVDLMVWSYMPQTGLLEFVVRPPDEPCISAARRLELEAMPPQIGLAVASHEDGLAICQLMNKHCTVGRKLLPRQPPRLRPGSTADARRVTRCPGTAGGASAEPLRRERGPGRACRGDRPRRPCLGRCLRALAPGPDRRRTAQRQELGLRHHRSTRAGRWI